MKISKIPIFDLLTALPAHHQRPTEATQTSQRRTIRPNSDALAGCRSPQVVWTVCDARGPAGVTCGGPCRLSTRCQAVARPGGPSGGLSGVTGVGEVTQVEIMVPGW